VVMGAVEDVVGRMCGEVKEKLGGVGRRERN
jgi:hypothetical protein